MSRIYDALKKAEQETQHQRTGIIPVTGIEPALHASAADAATAAVVEVSEGKTTLPSVPPADTPTTAAPESPVKQSVQTRTQSSQSQPRIQIFSRDGELRGAEELRRLRTKLQHARNKKPFRTLLVTSALPGEGKTFIAANLAQALTMQHGARVLLIDADLRKPQVHAQVGTSNDPGLSDYLEERCSYESVLRKTTVPNLHVIPGGRVSSRPAELAGSSRLAELLNIASEQFEWVVVDTSPVIPVSDAAVLSRICDAVLLVIRAGETSGEVAQAALSELKDANVIGAVLNRAQRRSAGYHHYYYYGYTGADTKKTRTTAGAR